ncbi:putative secreted protein (Por secretion system target) [Kordia periserrulae]|uniref:Putative secreted protein (Por secretion system target) n=1 Tax=Kordia periserrulae TaxID=701523 RepID=A0A2T6C1R8_9FLAO|nr:cellulase family glycosylhydrolase [Kordia periserrulae]PTX62255.1 putative secreted protein (Por secretion system target) [Kordia periserrulae]
MKTKNYVPRIRLALIVFCFATSIAFAQLLTVSNTGGKILKDGNPITLRGVNFGNWLLWEGYMMNLDKEGIKSHSQIRAGLKDLLGNSETKISNFENNWRYNYITNSDFAKVKELGFNVIRIPFHYNMFWDDATGTTKNDGFTWLDLALTWAKNNNVYVIFCMHAAPGYQNPDHHSDNPGTSVNFWKSDWSNVNIAKEVWKHVAGRYANRSGNEWLAGYDLLNEPVLDNNKHRLMQAYKEMTSFIRQVDTRHLVFAEGNYYGSDFYDMLERWDSKLVFSNHYYGPQGESNPNPSLNTIRNQALGLNIPLFTGEFGENTETWVKAARTDYDSQNVNWAFWAWKRENTARSIYSYSSPARWRNKIAPYLRGDSNNRPSVSETETTLNRLIGRIRLSNSTFRSSLHSLLIPPKPIGSYIWLRNNGKYVSSNNGSGPITANRTSIGGWEKFQVISSGDNKIALRGNNNRYVNSQNGLSEMTCNSVNASGWESFEWIEIDGKVALKGFNGKFVSSEGGSSSGMNCNRETASGWEVFDWNTTSAPRTATNDLGLITPANEEVIRTDFSIYPNPTADVLHFEFKEKSNQYSVAIYNSIGVEVLSQTIEKNHIDIRKLTAGSYVIHIKDEFGQSYSKLFIKK